MITEKTPVPLWLDTLDSNNREFNFSQLTDIEQQDESYIFVEVIDENVKLSEYLSDKHDHILFIAETHADGASGFSTDKEFNDFSVNIIGQNLKEKETKLVYIDSPRMSVVSDNNELDSEFWSYGITFNVNIVAISRLYEHAVKECLYAQR